jgi:hypothetical protein
VLRIERDGRQAIALVGFPLVDLAVLVAVLFGRHDTIALEMFDTRDLSVPPRRHFNALDRACRAGERPRVLFAVLGSRETDFLDLLIDPVVLPAVDLAVFVGIDIDTHGARAVHVTPRINRAISVRVVLEKLELPGFGVVHGLDALRSYPPLATCRDDRDKNDTNQHRVTA